MPQATHDHDADSDLPLALDEGNCYLVRGKLADTTYRVFKDVMDQGIPGLCVSRLYPDRVRSRYNLEGASVWWISHSPGEDRYDPSSIGTLSAAMEAFIESHPEGSVILLDGVEFIMNNLGFAKALFFVERLHEYVMQRRAIVLIPVDPGCFEPTEYARLERFLIAYDEEEVRKALETRELDRELLKE